jgi:CheY-like chemotaxis protein
MPDQRKRVLIAEDDPALSLVIRFYLGKAGFELLVARNGREAWDVARKCHCDLVVTDEQMPEMTGTQLCQRLRNDPYYVDIPIVMVTVKALETDVDQICETLRVSAVVPKPFSPKRLLGIVEDCLDEEPMGAR